MSVSVSKLLSMFGEVDVMGSESIPSPCGFGMVMETEMVDACSK